MAPLRHGTEANLSQRPILVVVDDVFFLASIRDAAHRAAVAVDAITLAEFARKSTETAYGAVIVDLNGTSASPVDLVRRFKSEHAARPVPVVGFVSHVQGDLIRAARAAGCERILARSAFMKALPTLLRELAEARNADDVDAG